MYLKLIVLKVLAENVEEGRILSIKKPRVD
jgi:hypothetical protein